MVDLLTNTDVGKKGENFECKDANDCNEFSCDMCEKQYTNKKVFMAHKREHVNKYTCDICKRTYNRKDTLLKHSKIHLKTIQCQICQTEFTNENEKYHHAKKVHGENRNKKYSIEFKIDAVKKVQEMGLVKASKELGVSDSALSEWRISIFNPLYCSFCGKSFARESYLQLHEENAHNGNGNRNVQKSNEDKKEEHQCDKCSKLFFQPFHLKNHMIYCNGYPLDKSCYICKKEFATKQGRREHIRFIHKKERNFCCEYCTKKFATSSVLKQHITDVHEQSGNFACGFCEKRYFKEGDKIVHERKHTGEKPYKCERCGESCSRYKAKKAEFMCEKCNGVLLQILKKVNSGITKDKNKSEKDNNLNQSSKAKQTTNLRELYKQKYSTDGGEVLINGASEESELSQVSDVNQDVKLVQNIVSVVDHLPQNKTQNHLEEIEDGTCSLGQQVNFNDNAEISNSSQSEESYFPQSTKDEINDVDNPPPGREIICENKPVVHNFIEASSNAQTMKESTGCYEDKSKDVNDPMLDDVEDMAGFMKTDLKKEIDVVLEKTVKEEEFKINENGYPNEEDNDNPAFLLNLYLARNEIYLGRNEPKDDNQDRNIIKSNSSDIACDLCKKKFAKKQRLREHIIRVHNSEGNKKERKFFCDICQKNYKTRNGLREHTRLIHENEKITCEICTKEFARKSDFIKHTKDIHEQSGKFGCTFCEKKFCRDGDKKKHERKHSGEKPYQCEICGERFKRKITLTHLNSHIGVNAKEFQCVDCGKQFATKSVLKRHVQSRKTDKSHCSTRFHSGVPEFKCYKCDRQFNSTRSLRQHVYSAHLDGLPCNTCDGKVNDELHLNEHLKSESRKRRPSPPQKTGVSEVVEYDSEANTWQCNVCWMTNKDKARVRAHAEVHFKEFSHSCPHCGIQKKTSTALRMHVISYHKNKE